MALKLIPVTSSREIYSCSYLDSEKKSVFLAPSPKIADAIRSRLHKVGQFSIDSITVFNFVSTLMKSIGEDFEFTKKSELILGFSTVFSQRFPNLGMEEFEKAYTLFSEYRSFALDVSLIDELLDRENPQVAEAIRLFWLLLENQQWLDEHGAYDQVSKDVAQAEFSLLREDLVYDQIVLWGFKHLTGVQVEFLKNLSRIVDVFLIIPSEIVPLLESRHWYSWLVDTSSLDRLIKKDLERKAKLFKFPKGRLTKAIESVWREHQASQILISKKEIQIDQVLEISKSRSLFKNSFDFLSVVEEKFFSKIKEELFLNTSSAVENETLFDWIKIQQGKAMLSVDLNESFKELKVISEFEKVLKEWQELSEGNTSVKLFSLSVLQEVTHLNLPRNFLIPLGEDQESNKTTRIFGLGDLIGLEPSEQTIVCVKKDNDYSFGESDSYSQEVREVLLSLGPMKDKNLDYLIDKFFIDELLENERVTFLLEEGIQEQDLAWSETLGEFDLQTVDFSSQKSKEVIDYPKEALQNKEFKLSASSFQSYLDCPRKYFYQHILGFGKQPQVEKDFSGRVLGQIEHKVIELYLKQHTSYDEEKLLEIIHFLWNKNWGEKEEELETQKDLFFSEVQHNVTHTIQSLFLLKKSTSDLEWQLEKTINEKETRGSIDLLLKLPEGFGVIDFKRGQFSIPSKSQVENFQSSQLWFYVYHYLKQNERSFDDSRFFGYLCLNSPELSKIFVRDEALGQHLISSGFVETSNIVYFKDSFLQKLEEFSEFFTLKKEEIKKDQTFIASPRSASLCSLCPGQLVCDRGING